MNPPHVISDFFDSPELLDIQRTGFYNFLKEGIPQLLAKEFPIKVRNGNYSVELSLNEKTVKLIAPEDDPRDCILKMKTYNCKLYAQVNILCKKYSSTPYKYKSCCKSYTNQRFVRHLGFGAKSNRQVSGASGTSANLCPLGQRFARRFVRQTKQSFVVGQSPKPKSKIPNPFSEKKEKIVYQSLPEWVLLGQLPMMTKRGHFIINGSPRVIVHQVVRSPGIYFQKLLKKDDQNKARFYGDIIPLKGVWIRLQMTKKGRVEAKFKKGKKIEVELLQKCLQVLENQTLSPSSAIFNKSIHFSYANDRVATCVNGLTLHRSWSDNAFYKSLTNRRLVLPPAYKSLICKSFARKHTVQSSNQTKTKDILNKDARFLLYDEYSTLFDKKKNRAESKAEYDAFIHTYDKLYRTTQDKELEEWQKKKRNQNFFKSSSSLSALESSVEKTRLSAQQKSSSKSKTYPSKQFCNSFIVPFETNLKSEGFYPEEKEQSQKSFCKASKENNKKMFSDAHSPYVRKPCCIYTQNEALQENKDRIKGGTYSYTVNGKRNQALFPAHDQWSAPFSSPENAFKRKKCSENLFSTFKLQSRYDLGLLGREKINNKFGLLRNRSFLGQRNILASGLRFGIRDLGFGAKPYKCKSLICKKICNRSRTSANLLQIKDLYGKATCSFGAKICNRNRTNQRLVAEAPARSNFFFQTKKKTSKRVKFSGYQNTLFTDNGTTQLTAFDLCSATLWLYKLRKGEQSTDDIDHSQNRRVRTSGDLLQTQFENGVSRLKNLLSTKLQEWRGDLNNSTFSAIFKSSWKTRYTSSTYFKGAKKAELSYVDKKALLTTLSNCSILTSDVDLRFKSVCADKSSCKARRSIRKTICTCAEKVATTQSNNRFLKDQSNTISHKFLAKELFTTKPITGALREFFGSNPLSQYMDQTNPLAEITHKRRISSLGTGGVSRESAGMAIRGIHPTHYGRICPIETPEGKNAGLVNSLAFYTKIDRDGFLRTPYYRVFKGQIQSSLGFAFCSAKEESVTGLQIAPSDLQKSSNNILRTRFSTPESVPVRVADNLLDVFKKENPYKVQLIAISPIQMISVATSLIPFLEHNDANRALMGSNMQRQAVPLMLSERPVVGTGLESIVIVESGHITESPISGFASHVTANRIVIDRLSYKKKEGPFCMSTSLSYFFENKIGNGAFAPNPKSQIPNPKVLVKSSCKSLPFGAKICKKPGTSKIEDFKGQRFALVRRKALDKSLLYKATSRKRSLARIIDKNLGEVIAYGDGLQSFTFSTSLSNRRFVYMCKSWCRVTRHQKIGKIYAYQTSERLKKARAIGRLRLDSQDLLDVANSKSKALLPSSWADASQNKTSKRYSVLHVQKKGLYFLKSFFMLRRVERASIKGRYIQKQSCLLSAVSLLTTFSRSNQNTCITEKPLIKEFDWVQKGDILSDCSASNKGELAVGKNVLLAYIPWEGYNFEDAIVISERLVKEHVYTSLHIERYVFQAQDLKDGNEWFTNQLPGIEPHSIQHLEESGLPKVGSFLKEGDIIVGKIRYLNKKPSSPYERLLCDILGEKNFAARNKSLYVPKGVEARVIYHKVVSIFDNDLENKVRPLEAPKTVHVFLGEKRVIQVGDKISGRHGNKGVISTILPRQDMPYLPDGTPIDIILNPLGVPSRMNVGQVLECLLGLAATYLNQNFKITAFDEKYGVEASKSIVFLKLYQARLQSGQNWLFQVAFPGKTRLVDGRSGECFDQWITVGRAYILKLIHMVSEKIHARSTGPYALITQQPLRGRSNKGGQRLGEMEVWALEGFGAAYTLQELLTKKSDDFFGRKQIVDSILPNPTSIVDTLKPSNRIDQNRSVLGHPEIFKVLLCELQALCLDLGVYIVTPDSFQRSFLGIIH